MNSRRWALVAVLLCVCVCGASAAELPEARAVVPAQVELGRPFELSLIVRHGIDNHVYLPVSLPLGEAFFESQRQSEQSRLVDGTMETRFRITLAVFDTKVAVVPALVYEYRDALGTHVRHSTPVPLKVRGLVDPANLVLRPISDPVEVPVRNMGLVMAVCGGLLLLLFTFVLLRVRRKRRHAEPSKIAEAPLAPDVLAHRQLDELEASGRLDGTQQKEVFLRLSEILRAYLGQRFGFPALDLTTSEIRSRLRGYEGSRSWLGAVTQWLESCDLVKYANSPSDTEDTRQALYAARILIDRTKEIEHEQPREIACA